MKQYLDALRYITDNGEDVNDRTGVGTKSIFGYQMRFNLQDGFPAVTTKRLAWKAVVGELLWFLEGSTDERRLAEITYGKDRKDLVGKSTIWTANADKQGKDLGYENNESIKLCGNIYGAQWRHFEGSDSSSIVEIPIQKYEEKPTTAVNLPTVKKIAADDDFIGKTLSNNRHEQFLVLDKRIKSPNSYYLVYYIAADIYKWVSRPNIKSGTHSSGLLHGVGIADYKGAKPYYYNKAYIMWYNMISRCYNSKHKTYKHYGAKGVSVSKRWHSLTNFILDLEKLPFFYNWVLGTHKKVNDYEIDKDYFGSDVYSVETSLFLPRKINKLISNHAADFSSCNKVTFPDGSYYFFITRKDIISKFPEFAFNADGIQLCLSNRQETHRGCVFTKVKARRGYIFRPKLFTDQIAWLINEIKTNPDSRRLILSAWNPNQINAMALPPCHTLAQFRVINGKLNCQLYQRSADMFLGVPFNIASYSLLTHMLAQICDLQVGDFVHTIGDAHIYKNHLEQVYEQLLRTPQSLPTLSMPNFDNLDQLLATKVDDYKLNGYTPMPSIKAEMAV